MTETKSPRNDFVSVSCKHDANCNIRAGLTSSRPHVKHVPNYFEQFQSKNFRKKFEKNAEIAIFFSTKKNTELMKTYF